MQIGHHELCEFGATALEAFAQDDFGNCANCQRITAVVLWHNQVMDKTWQPILAASVKRGKRQGILDALDALSDLDAMHCFECAELMQDVCQCTCALCDEANLVARAVYLIRARAK